MTALAPVIRVGNLTPFKTVINWVRLKGNKEEDNRDVKGTEIHK